MPLCVCDTCLIFLILCGEWKPYFIRLYLHNHNNTSQSLHSVYEIFQVCPKPLRFVKNRNVLVLPAQTQNSQLTRFYIIHFTTVNKKRFQTVKRGVKNPRQGNVLLHCVRVRFYWSENESDIASRWVHREFNVHIEQKRQRSK